MPTVTTEERERFWIAHGALPGAAFVLMLFAIGSFQLDARIAEALFYDREAHAWIGAHTWWAEAWIHTGGRNVVRAIVLAALAVLVGGYFTPRLRPWRKSSLFVVLAIVLSTGIVGILKQVTNVDCPWSLAVYGGTPSPSGAACFPGAHSSSGFALMCCYFLLRERTPLASRVALIAGFGVGALFAFGQEARGAHFLSHDLTSAALVWYVQLGLYAGLFNRAWRGRDRSARRSPCAGLRPRPGAPAGELRPAPSAGTAAPGHSRLPRRAARRRRSSDRSRSG